MREGGIQRGCEKIRWELGPFRHEPPEEETSGPEFNRPVRLLIII